MLIIVFMRRKIMVVDGGHVSSPSPILVDGPLIDGIPGQFFGVGSPEITM